jgi:hypothetical protein
MAIRMETNVNQLNLIHILTDHLPRIILYSMPRNRKMSLVLKCSDKDFARICYFSLSFHIPYSCDSPMIPVP